MTLNTVLAELAKMFMTVITTILTVYFISLYASKPVKINITDITDITNRLDQMDSRCISLLQMYGWIIAFILTYDIYKNKFYIDSFIKQKPQSIISHNNLNKVRDGE